MEDLSARRGDLRMVLEEGNALDSGRAGDRRIHACTSAKEECSTSGNAGLGTVGA
jgi:hypothetical protein